MADERFADYSPAPLNQNGFDKFARSGANAAVGGTKGIVLGFLGVPLLTTVAGAAIGALVIGAVSASIFGFAALGAGTAIAMGVGAVVLGGAGLWAGAGLAAAGGLVGGVIGASKGYSGERQRADIDQSFYNVALAEAMSRGSAQGQAMAYMGQLPVAQANVPVNAMPIRDGIVLEREDLKGTAEQPKTKVIADKMDTLNAASPVVTKDSVELQGSKPVALNHAQLVAAAANHNELRANAI